MQRLKFNQIEIPKPLARDPEHWTRDPILNQMTRGFREVQKPDLIQSWIFLLRQLTVFTDRIYVGLSPLVIRSDSIRVWIKSVVWGSASILTLKSDDSIELRVHRSHAIDWGTLASDFDPVFQSEIGSSSIRISRRYVSAVISTLHNGKRTGYSIEMM
jgi:hypothetical protein